MGDSATVLAADPTSVPTVPREHPGSVACVERTLAAAMADLLGVEQVALDGHFFDDLGADSMTMAQFCARVRKQSDLPSVSMKDVYRHPTIRDLAMALAPAPTRAASAVAEDGFAAVLAEVLGVEQVAVDGHFFDDLGADSMTMAQFCARVRKQSDLPSVSMKDVYRHPTIRDLAAGLVDGTPAGSEPLPSPSTGDAIPTEPAVPTGTVRPASTAQYVMCGTLQLLIFFGYAYLTALSITWGTDWMVAAPDVLGVYLRSVLFGGGLFLGLCIAPIAAKWILIGRWEPREIRVWSLDYVRFWLVKTLVRANPLAFLFVGTPVFALYLRALGAKVGRGVAIFTKHMPVCTDLITIGDGTVIRKDSFLTGYRAHAGVLQTGPVTLGRDVFIGEKTVLDIHTAVGDGAQLGHTSSLHTGMAVPAGERWHGSPAQRTEVGYRRVDPARCGTLRRVTFSVGLLLKLLLVYVPLSEGGVYMLLSAFPSLDTVLEPGVGVITSPPFYVEAATFSALLFFGGLLLLLVVLCTVPRVQSRFIKPDKVYPLYGFQYGLHRSISRATNLKFFMWLFGDSSYIVRYLQGLGYDLSRVEQTGSNFGTEVAHETPFLCSVGTGTMVADGLSVMNAEFSATSFRVSRTSIGARNFLGNNIAYPSGGRTGDNCLLATKAMVPLDGEVREGVGLLGSPPFEIPRSVARDVRLLQRRTPERLAAKNRYNLRSMALFLGVRWVHFCLLVLLGLVTADVYDSFGHVFLAAYLTLSLLLTAAYFVLVERAFTAFRPLEPRYCSIYEPYFWWHERLWKVPDHYLEAFSGTPFKNLIWRALGVRLGRRVFDDGVFITERTLAAIGDDSVLNLQSKIQCHSQEDGAFKSDHIVIGAGCTLGVAAFVHYGVTIGDGAVLEPDSFLMKGAEVPPHARWGGNPAMELEQPPKVPVYTAPARQAVGVGGDVRNGDRASSEATPQQHPGGRYRSDTGIPLRRLALPRPHGRHRRQPVPR